LNREVEIGKKGRSMPILFLFNPAYRDTDAVIHAASTPIDRRANMSTTVQLKLFILL